ncbi:MAG: hypothetical protein IPQ07_35990 [Myxococcales bacterium]|nr:hypothetical protein [Myxococcales bacterium]
MWLVLALAACGKSGRSAPPAGEVPVVSAALAPPGTPASVAVASPRITTLLERLHGTDPTARKQAISDLRVLGQDPTLTVDEGIQLLRATLASYPAPDEPFLDVPASIVLAVAARPRAAYTPVVDELFPRWAGRVRAQGLRLLAAIDDDHTAATFTRLLKPFALDPAMPSEDPMFLELERAPHHPALIVPALLQIADDPRWADAALLGVLAYCDKQLVTPDAFPGDPSGVLAAYAVQRSWLEPKQRPGGIGFDATDEYLHRREIASVTLDLMKCLPAPKVHDALVHALTYRDAHLAYFGVTSLLAHGEAVPAAAVERVAASPEMRGWLFRALTDHPELFPARYATQRAMAEAAMVSWLAYPTELGRPPDEIVLGKIVTKGPADFYVFKFRTLPPHWAAKDGWLAGIAGPYAHGGPLEIESPEGTFSSMKPYASATPEAHVGDVSKILEGWRKNRGPAAP